MPKLKYSLILKQTPVKLSLLIVIFMGVSLFFSGGKVAADAPADNSWNCPSASNDVPGNWGMQYGGLEHTFASVAVYAHEDGKSYSDGKLNVSYHLKSSVDKAHSYGPAPPGVPASLYPDARIFKYSGGVDDIKVNGRTDQRWFNTGETLTSSAGSCRGWSEIGPGTSTNVGNGFILDCQEKDTGGTLRSNHFWIDSISTPTGEAGQWGGNWTIQISSGGRASHGTPYPMGYDSNPNPGTSNNLLVENGDNARVDLTWHPNPPPITCATNPNMPQCRRQVDAECKNAFIENISTAGGNRKRTHVVIGGITVNQNGGGGPNYDVYNNIENPDPSNVPWGTPPGTYNNIDQFVPSSGGEDDTDVKTGKKWFYQPNTNSITIDITVEALYDNGDGSGEPSWHKITDIRHDTVQCFSAQCDMTAYGDGPGGIILAGGNIHFSGNFYNTSPPPDNMTLWWPAVKDQGGGLHGVNVEQVYAGGSPYPFSFDAPAPGSITEQNWSFTPVYFAGESIGSACTASVKTFKPFNLTPHAGVELTPSVEDPTNAKYIGYADTGFSDPYYPSGFKVHYDADSQQKRYGGVVNHVDQVNYGFGNITTPYVKNIDPRPNQAGDEYCLANFFVYETSGWIGPNNEFAYTNSDYSPLTACQHVYDRPYLKAYGADVISGSAFRSGDTCTPITDPNRQKISAYRSIEAGKGGSGVQFAAIALAQISGFGSASTRTTSPTSPTGLTFANSGAGVVVNNGAAGADQPNDGGYYGGQATCTQDFYSTQKTPVTTAAANVNINTSAQVQDEKQTLFNRGGGNLSLTTSGSDFNKKSALFVDGNVIIRRNITFQPGKYLAIIAKGNIYIDRNVTRLDGLYIAQPRDDGSRGNIYTCTNLGTTYAAEDLYNNCRSQLVINGAFAAQSVKFLRVSNSLRDSTSREVPSNFSDGSGTKAAEIFNFSPEIYLYTPIFDNVTTGQPYQYITTLPPVL